MRMIRTFFLALAAALVAVQLAGCASSDTRRASGQVVDDASIECRTLGGPHGSSHRGWLPLSLSQGVLHQDWAERQGGRDDEKMPGKSH